MKMNSFRSLIVLALCLFSLASTAKKEVYLFSYFVDNGQD